MRNVFWQACRHRATNALPRIFALLITCVIMLPTVQADDWEMSASVGYEGRYLSWGDKELESGGLYSLSFDAEKNGFIFTIWVADAQDHDFHESNLSFGYGWHVTEDLEAGIHFVREDSYEDSKHGHNQELEASLAYESANWTASLEYVYATENQRDALAFKLSGEYEIGGFGVHPATELIYDWGDSEENALSSVQLHLGISRKLSETLSVETWLVHQTALNSQRDEYHSLAWGGIGFTASF